MIVGRIVLGCAPGGGDVSRLPNPSSAVMARRAPAEVESDDARTKVYRAIDYYPTPPWAARAGAEIIKRLDLSAPTIWEPACGEGHMAEPLREYFAEVFASDIYPHGYGAELDFLSPKTPDISADWVVTNPPFKLAADFVRRGLEVAKTGVAVLVRLSWLESEDRFSLLHEGPAPLTILAPFSERVPMQLGSWDPGLATATAYAYFIFLKNQTPRWAARIHPIPPGTKLRLTKETDARRFARRASAPLFDGVDA